MGWSESDSRCKKHPNDTQPPGVCSSCLRERLSQLSSTRTGVTASSCTSSTPSSYSSAYESPSSPPHHLSTNAKTLVPNEGFFGRSRSMVQIAHRSRDAVSAVEKKKKKMGGFWSRLLRPVSSKRRKEPFLHSNTMKEVPANWAAQARK